MLHPYERQMISRRSFAKGVLGGLAIAGIPLAYVAAHNNHWLSRSTQTPAPKPLVDGMPGAYRGRVVEVHDDHAVDNRYAIDQSVVRNMLDRGMCEFTGADHPVEAWQTFFSPGEIVGIKVNPVGKGDKSRPNIIGSISNPAVVLEIVRNLKQIGIRPRDIVIFERYASEFIDAGYEKMMREPLLDGVRWAASGAGYSAQQLAISGVNNPNDYSPELLKHVAGYDPDHFVHMGFAAPEHSQNDDRRFRSHLSTIVTRMVDKFITIPVLKDHRSAGVTLSLKNMSHGLNNNVARSHIGPQAHGYPGTLGYGIDGPNQCNVFIPTAVNQQATKQKATLHIMDGLIAVYEGGPGVWNKSWGTWRKNSLFFSTDPVAMDHVGWDVIDAKRVSLGLPRVGEVGRRDYTPDKQARMIASAMLPGGTLDALSEPLARVRPRRRRHGSLRPPHAGAHNPGLHDRPGRIRPEQDYLQACQDVNRAWSSSGG